MSRWLRALVAGLSGIFGMYLGGLLGVILSIALFDSPSVGLARGLELFAGLLFAVVLTTGAAFVAWLAGPTVVAAVMQWPRVGTAFVVQLLTGFVVLVAVGFWLLTRQDDVSGASLVVAVVVGHVVAGVVPAASRWLVDPGVS